MLKRQRERNSIEAIYFTILVIVLIAVWLAENQVFLSLSLSLALCRLCQGRLCSHSLPRITTVTNISTLAPTALQSGTTAHSRARRHHLCRRRRHPEAERMRSGTRCREGILRDRAYLAFHGQRAFKSFDSPTQQFDLAFLLKNSPRRMAC